MVVPVVLVVDVAMLVRKRLVDVLVDMAFANQQSDCRGHDDTCTGLGDAETLP